jgi:hypothetical protein
MKILIVDDNSFSKKFIQDFVLSLGVDVDYFCTPSNYDAGLSNISENFDIALFDYDLCDKKTGYDLYCLYVQSWPKSIAYLYSANAYIVNRTPGIKTTCLSDTELQDMLRYHINHKTFKTIEKDSMTMTPPVNSMAMPMFIKEACDEKHLAIKERADKYEERNEADHKALRDVLKEMSSKLDTSNAQGRQTFWAMIVFGIGVMGTFITIAVKILGAS